MGHHAIRAALGVSTFLILSSSLPAQAPPRLGNVDFPTSAGGPAQQEFITGVLYLHSFEYRSAADAFRRAQRLDPGFALAFWGEAMTYTHPVWNQQDTAAAVAALQRLAPTRAARLTKARSPRERAYLEAVEVLYGQGSKAARDTAYSQAMQRVAEAYPADPEANAFFALSLLGLNQGARDVPTYMRAGAIAQDLFAEYPRHPGAAHYVIHAFDDPVHAPLGLKAARAYSAIAPDAAHAQHMTSHIFVALGMWDETVHANEIATAATRDTARAWPRWSCGHYADWLHYAYLQQGRPAAASRLMDECAAQGAATGRAPPRVSLISMRAAQIVDGEQWDGAAARLSVDTAGQNPFTRSLFAFGTGYAAARRGDTAVARVALASLAALSPMARVEDRGYAEIMLRELEAFHAVHTGQTEQAVASLKRAIAVEDSVPVDFGPPIAPKPPRELLAELLVHIGRPADAQRELERQLQRTPRRAATLAMLVRAAEAAGNRSVAADASREIASVRHSAESVVAGQGDTRR